MKYVFLSVVWFLAALVQLVLILITGVTLVLLFVLAMEEPEVLFAPFHIASRITKEVLSHD